MIAMPGAETLPPSSLIICTRNRSDLLIETIQSVLNAEVVPDELIIVDQSDNPNQSLGNFKAAQECEIRYIWVEKTGSSYARNYGISEAKHDIVAFIDDDMTVTPTWYQALIRALISGGVKSVVTGRVEPAPTQERDKFVIAVHTWDESKDYAGRIGMDILATGLMAIYRTAYLEVGGLDEELGPGTHFPGAEDNDFGFRLLEAGYKIKYAADVVVYHRAWRDRRDYLPLFWNYGRGQGAFYAKHRFIDSGYMQSRMKKDFQRFLSQALKRILHGKLLVFSGSAAFVLGEWSGAIEWMILHRNKINARA